MDKPIPMILYCPNCGEQHVDAPDTNPCRRSCRYAVDVCMPEATCAGACQYMQEGSPRWTNPPHRSHQCGTCGCIWRPADVPTTGVADIQTSGKSDTWPVYPQEVSAAPAVHKT